MKNAMEYEIIIVYRKEIPSVHKKEYMVMFI